MQFLVRAYDGPDMLGRRLAVRPRHLEGMDGMREHVVCAGGLVDEGGRMVGSMLVLDLPDRAALDAYLEREPYLVEGVWERCEVDAMNVVILDGKTVSR